MFPKLHSRLGQGWNWEPFLGLEEKNGTESCTWRRPMIIGSLTGIVPETPRIHTGWYSLGYILKVSDRIRLKSQGSFGYLHE